nr:hypothetical protein [Tanacetum cinerariifolium]
MNVDNSSSGTTLIIEKIRKFKDLLTSGQAILVDKADSPLKKVEFLGEYESEDEVASINNDMARSMEYERKMRIEQYFLMTGYSLWEVILNGDSPMPTRFVEGVLQLVAPTTAEQSFEGLDQIHDRLQKLVSQLEIHGVSLSQEDVNLKFIRSLPSKWKTHTLIWRNKADLKEQSLDDLFNNLKIYETEVKQSSSTGIASQKLAFVSSSHTDSTTDSVSAAASVSAACAKLPVSSLPNVDSLSNAVIYSFFASQSTSPQLDNEDLKQIDVDDLEEMDLRWQMAMLTIRARRFLQKTGINLGANGPTSMGFDISKVECYNCHRKGHFARECRLLRIQEEEEPANYALMTFSSSSSSSDIETGLESVEARLLVYKQNESVFEENIKLLNIKVQLRDTALVTLRQKLKKAEHDKDDLKLNLVLLSLNKTCTHTTRPSAPIIEDWVFDSEDESKTKALQFVPIFVQSSEQVKSPRHSVKPIETSIPAATPTQQEMAQPTQRIYVHRGNHKQYASLPHQKPQKHMVPTAMLTQSKLVYNIVVRLVSAAVLKIMVTRPRLAHPIVTKSKSHVRRHITRSLSPKTSNSPPKVIAAQAPVGNPQYALKDKGVINSGCSRHMIGNMSYLSDFEELNRGYVAFGGNLKGGKITGKGKIKTDSLLPIPFWAEAVNTACYVQNRVLVTKPHNKTPYELLHGRTPSIGFMRPFGCPNSYCSRDLVNFLENKPNVTGRGPTWLFDIDSLTRTMNYQPVVAGNQTNPSAGFQDKFDAEKEHDFDVKKPESEVILFPSSSAQSRKQDDKTKKEAKGKSPIESFIGYRDLNAEFEDCSNNSSNKVNVAGSIVPTVRQNSLNNTNTFSAVGPSNDITYSDDEDVVGAEADFNNLESSIPFSPIPIIRIHKDHPVSQIIGDMSSTTQTRRGTQEGSEDPNHPDKVYKVVKALYGLHQAPRAWYGTLATYLLENNDIIFGATNKDLCKSFEQLMKDKFQLSSMGELTFFLGLHVKQKKDGIFISQDKYVVEILRKFGLTKGKSASTPIDTEKPLLKDPDGEDVDVHTYRSMIGSLMYLTLSRPDIMFACKKQTVVATSSTEPEYVAAAS